MVAGSQTRPLPAEIDSNTLIERVPGIVYVAEPGENGRWVYVSPQIEGILGYTPEQWRARPKLWCERIHEEDRQRVLEAEAQARAGAISLDVEYRMIARDGRVVWLHDKASLVHDDSTGTALLQGVLIDISAERISEEALRVSEAQKSAVIESAIDCIITIDGDGLVRDFNPAAERTFGYTFDEVVGRELADLIIPPAFRDTHRAALRRAVETGEGRVLGRRMELVGMRSDGSKFPLELALSRISQDPPLFTGYLRDISHRRQAEEDLREGHERLQAVIDNSPSMISAKDAGGRYLFVNREFERLYTIERDSVVGRTDEELFPPHVASETSASDQRVIEWGELVKLEEVRRRASEDRTYLTQKFPLRDSTGAIHAVCSISTDITERKAREEALRAEIGWSTRIRAAIESDRLVLHAQPILDLRTGHIFQHELLVRMRGDRGEEDLIPPNVFLPPAERFGLVREIDRWVVSQAMVLATDRRVEVNLSGKSIGDEGLIEHIERELRRHQVDPGNVIFEITETAAAENIEAASAFVRKLTDAGCGFALDDFGTGFGSFNYLKHLPVTYLKIDMEFVRELTTSRSDHKVVKAIVQVASNFGMETVAEGVEDDATLAVLRGLGVDYGQGFAIGRPGPLPPLEG